MLVNIYLFIGMGIIFLFPFLPIVEPRKNVGGIDALKVGGYQAEPYNTVLFFPFFFA